MCIRDRLYWMRIEGRSLDRIAELLQVRSQPVLEGINEQAVKQEFECAFQHMSGTRPSDAALASAAVAAIIGLAFHVRLSEPGLVPVSYTHLDVYKRQAEYWIVNGQDRCIECYRDPAAGRYQTLLRITEGSLLQSTALPAVSVDIAELFAGIGT